MAPQVELYASSQGASLRVGKLLGWAFGGGSRHHGCFNHSLGRVIDGHNTITIDHPVVAHHITAVPRWKSEGTYPCGETNRAGRPVFSSINGVGPRAAE